MNSTRKGTRWAKAVADYLQSFGFDIDRRLWLTAGDDMTATRGRLVLSIEAKSVRRLDVATIIDQCEQQAKAPTAIPVAFVHRRGKSAVDDAHVLMSGRSFAALISPSAGGAEPPT